jgi:hypothetical protein
VEDSELFLAEVANYIGPNIGQFNYEEMVRGFPDRSRFYDLARELSRFRSPKHATVLSSGCGFAGSVFVWAEEGAARVWGLEVDAEMARTRGPQIGDHHGCCRAFCSR